MTSTILKAYESHDSEFLEAGETIVKLFNKMINHLKMARKSLKSKEREKFAQSIGSTLEVLKLVAMGFQGTDNLIEKEIGKEDSIPTFGLYFDSITLSLLKVTRKRNEQILVDTMRSLMAFRDSFLNLKKQEVPVHHSAESLRFNC